MSQTFGLLFVTCWLVSRPDMAVDDWLDIQGRITIFKSRDTACCYSISFRFNLGDQDNSHDNFEIIITDHCSLRDPRVAEH